MGLRTRVLVRLVLTAAVLLCSRDLFAQGQTAIAGVVRDSSGAVLPGVTVEASSPALIERSRSAVTDGQGQYRIIDLRPGVYSVTFTLQGFNTHRRDGIELTTSFTAQVNADLKVGSIQDSGSAPRVTSHSHAPVTEAQHEPGARCRPRCPNGHRAVPEPLSPNDFLPCARSPIVETALRAS